MLPFIVLFWKRKHIPIFSAKSTWVLFPCLQISLPFKKAPVICFLMTQQELLSESNNTFFHFQLYPVGVILFDCTSTSRAVTMQEREGEENCPAGTQGRSVADPTCVIEQPCSFSSGQHETWMATQILTFILDLIDSHQSCWARSITFPGSLKLPALPFFLFSN